MHLRVYQSEVIAPRKKKKISNVSAILTPLGTGQTSSRLAFFEARSRRAGRVQWIEPSNSLSI